MMLMLLSSRRLPSLIRMIRSVGLSAMAMARETRSCWELEACWKGRPPKVTPSSEKPSPSTGNVARRRAAALVS
jgi:hypothetical protein